MGGKASFIVIIIFVALIAILIGGIQRAGHVEYAVLPPEKSAILITGTSTGIGRHAAEALAADGYHVFAGVRKEGDIPASDHLHPIILDVTDPDSITSAVAEVERILTEDLKENGVTFKALVNNAGIAYAMPVQLMDIDRLRQVFEVNVMGVVGCTKAFVPLLQKNGGGRLVIIGSVAGFVSLPVYGPYAASKHALEALTDSSRMELSRWNISVSIIEPGSVKSSIREKSRGDKAAYKSLSPDDYALYAHYFDNTESAIAKIEASAAPTSVTTEAIRHALLDPFPQTRYGMYEHATSLLCVGPTNLIIPLLSSCSPIYIHAHRYVVASFRGLPVWPLRMLLPFIPDRVLDRLKTKAQQRE